MIDRPPVSLLGAAEIRRLADELDLRPTKTLGQNFVHDANTVRRIVAAAGLRSTDHVLEVGPGLGSLTLGLLDTSAAVTAVEIDPRLAGRLPRTVAEHAPERPGYLRVITADALEITGDRLALLDARCRRRPPIPPPWWRTCRTTSPCRCCCTCWPRCRLCGGCW